MDLELVFKDFCNKLRTRTEFTSEDTIRYYWFMSMLRQDPEPNHYLFEAPYPRPLEKKELDLLYINHYLTEQIAFEIKFHRSTTKSTFAHTDATGSIFGDLLRLPFFNLNGSNINRRFFLYVTDREMDKYLRYLDGGAEVHRQSFKKFYELLPKCNLSLSWVQQIILSTFNERINSSLGGIKPAKYPTVAIMWKDDFIINNPSFKENLFCIRECHVRLYEVLTSVSGEDLECKLDN